MHAIALAHSHHWFGSWNLYLVKVTPNFLIHDWTLENHNWLRHNWVLKEFTRLHQNLIPRLYGLDHIRFFAKYVNMHKMS